jgi:hypothetical protein
MWFGQERALPGQVGPVAEVLRRRQGQVLVTVFGRETLVEADYQELRKALGNFSKGGWKNMAKKSLGSEAELPPARPPLHRLWPCAGAARRQHHEFCKQFNAENAISRARSFLTCVTVYADGVLYILKTRPRACF